MSAPQIHTWLSHASRAAAGLSGYVAPTQLGLVEVPGVGVVKVATMGQRLLAKLIDLGVYVGLSLGLFVIAVLGRLAGEAIGIGAVLGMVPYFLMCLVVFLFWPLYDSIMISRRGATIGMKSIGLRVINQADGRLLSGGAAFVRWLIPAVGTLIPIVGALLIYLSPLFDSSGRMQGWHDKAAGDLVIATR